MMFFFFQKRFIFLFFKSETNDSEHEPITTKTKGSRGGKRPSTRQPKVRQKSLRLDENDEASMGVIREEDVVDLSMIDHNKSCRIFNNSTNLSKTYFI